jgi:outer membrane receptor protein involved in Fe transport
VYYGSFPELFQPEFEGAVDLLSIDGSTLASYGAERLGGDWVFDARVNYRAGERFALNFVVKNITNRLYAMRPSRPEPIRNFTFQVNYTFH